MPLTRAIRLTGFARAESLEIRLARRCRFAIGLLALANLGMAVLMFESLQTAQQRMPECAPLIQEAVLMMVVRATFMFTMALIGLYICNQHLHCLRRCNFPFKVNP